MNLAETSILLAAAGEETLLNHFDTLSTAEQRNFLSQISTIDFATLHRQKLLLKQPQEPPTDFSPFTDYAYAGNLVDQTAGRSLISQGAVGCLIIAGGQGTRLNFNGPKGCFPVTPIKQKSLFQFFSEKVLAASIQAGTPLPLAIMTSPQNHTETVEFFRAHQNFGLGDGQISFFSQGELPFLDPDGHLILDSPSKIATGPDGNGAALLHFYQHGPGKRWEALGIKFVNFVVIDNALADPFDSELIGYHARLNNEITVKCTARNSPEEKVGVLGYSNGKTAVIEYSELPETARLAKNSDGSLLYGCANLSLFCFSLDFIKNHLADMQSKMPIHPAFKPTKCAACPIGWKFEKFIFDLLPLASKVSALLYPRQECFAPLKNKEGADSPQTVAAALKHREIAILESITETKVDDKEIEIDPQFYYPTQKLIEKWKGKSDLKGYVGK